MAAPAGVNEGLSPEPVASGTGNAGQAGAEHAGPAEEAGPAGAAGTAEHAATAVSAGPAVSAGAAGGAGTAGYAGAEHSAGAAGLGGDAGAPAEAEAAPGGGEAPDGEAPEETGPAPEEAAEAHDRRELSPLAIVAIAVGIMALVGVAFGVLAAVTHGFRAKVVVTYRPAAVFSLRPGDCVNSGPNGLAVTRLSCATPHDAEVFATFSLPKASWPGEAVIRQQAGDGCAGRLMGYLNPQLADAGLSQEFVYPDRAAWTAGVRTVVCEVSSPNGRLSGSVRNPGS
jgi:Septum formation